MGNKPIRIRGMVLLKNFPEKKSFYKMEEKYIERCIWEGLLTRKDKAIRY